VTRAGSACLGLAWALVAGCEVQQSGAPPEPATSSGAEQGSYPGRCALVGVQMLEAPTDRASVDSGSVQVVATYRPGAGAPLDLAFLVRRERVNDLRAHLEQHPSVLCVPRSQEGDDHSYDVQVPPFEGQPGKPK